jgi:hypothetical protein
MTLDGEQKKKKRKEKESQMDYPLASCGRDLVLCALFPELSPSLARVRVLA